MEWKRSRQIFMSKIPLFYWLSICFFSIFTLVSTINTRTVCLDIKNPSARRIDCYNQEFEKVVEKGEEISISSSSSRRSKSSWRLKRRNLSGPGSSPPRCTSKCGKCTPCKAVHVPVPPGTHFTTEYYPEAWMCKCHNKLYIP